MAIVNNNTVTEYGMKAASAWDRATSNGDAGDALAVAALYNAFPTMTFACTVERKKEDIVETVDFDLIDWLSPVFNADGTKDTRAMNARTHAVILKVFGISEGNVSPAIKTRVDRAKKCAAYLYNRHAAMSDDDYATAVTMKGNKLVVPYAAVTPEPKDDASDNEKTVYEAMAAKPLTLDGKKGASLAELSKRANPPKARREQASKEEGNGLNEAVSYITGIMLSINSSDESDVALSNQLREKLYHMQMAIAQYFTTDPIGDIEDSEAQDMAA